MTKKYWIDWQKRIGETKNIWLFSKYYGNSFYGHYLLDDNDCIVKISFHGNTVDLVIERHTKVIDWNTRSLKHHIENEHLTLHRVEIASIEFVKY
jgi:hypothetical protein